MGWGVEAGRKEGEKERARKRASGEGKRKLKQSQVLLFLPLAPLFPRPTLLFARGKPSSAGRGVCEAEGKVCAPAARCAVRRPARAAPRAGSGRCGLGGSPRPLLWCWRSRRPEETMLRRSNFKVTGDFRGEAEWFGTGHVSDKRQIPKVESDKK